MDKGEISRKRGVRVSSILDEDGFAVYTLRFYDITSIFFRLIFIFQYRVYCLGVVRWVWPCFLFKKNNFFLSFQSAWWEREKKKKETCQIFFLKNFKFLKNRRARYVSLATIDTTITAYHYYHPLSGKLYIRNSSSRIWNTAKRGEREGEVPGFTRENRNARTPSINRTFAQQPIFNLSRAISRFVSRFFRSTEKVYRFLFHFSFFSCSR